MATTARSWCRRWAEGERSGSGEPCGKPAGDDPLHRLQVALGDALGLVPSRDAAAQSAAQTLLAIQAARKACPHAFDSELVEWVVATADASWRPLANWLLTPDRPFPQEPSWTSALGDADRKMLEDLVDSVSVAPFIGGDRRAVEELGAFLERLLNAWDGGAVRSHRGVFYTPASAALGVVAMVHDQMRHVLGCSAGLLEPRLPPGVESLDVSPDAPLSIVDPACGAGVFLAAAVDWCHLLFRRLPWADRDAAWNAFLGDNLIPRLHGVDLILPACASAHLNVALHLRDSGYRFATSRGPSIVVGNSLRRNTADLLSRAACSVIVSNPPFRALSINADCWIEDLLRGKDSESSDRASYFRIADDVLRERKHWLHDDYVKFLRMAHWLVEKQGFGVMGLVANHGFLDNVSFRILRRSLLQDFPSIALIDLHGNAKKGETSAARPPRLRDANIFSIEQGVAIGVFAKPPARRSSVVRHAELWGSAELKTRRLRRMADELAALGSVDPSRLVTDPHRGAVRVDRLPKQELASFAEQHAVSPVTTLQPSAPYFLMIPSDASAWREFSRGVSLPDLMPYYSTAPVTARDGLVVAFTKDELLQRLRRFCDSSLPDDVIRREMFPAARTQRYPPGDTRGWRLDEARRRLAGQDLRDSLRPCLYRPYDLRWILWRADMIDWPRDSLVKQLDIHGNWLLVTRRRMLPGRDGNFFWATRHLTVDGVLRSDNRGSEALFPLWIEESGRPPRANFDPDLLARLIPPGIRVDAPRSACLMSCYLYGLFHSATYRHRFSECLANEFPRVFAPRSGELFQRIADLGRRLLSTHWMTPLEDSAEDDSLGSGETDSVDRQSWNNRWVIEKGFPRCQQGRIWVNRRMAIGSADPESWNFRAGAHQVCRKWLRDRQGRSLTSADRQRYRRLLRSVSTTLRGMRAIERCIQSAGGWSRAFAIDS